MELGDFAIKVNSVEGHIGQCLLSNHPSKHDDALTIPQSTTMQAHMEPRCFTQKDVQCIFLQIQIAFDPLPATFLQEPETLHLNVYDKFCS